MSRTVQSAANGPGFVDGETPTGTRPNSPTSWSRVSEVGRSADGTSSVTCHWSAVVPARATRRWADAGRVICASRPPPATRRTALSPVTDAVTERASPETATVRGRSAPLPDGTATASTTAVAAKAAANTARTRGTRCGDGRHARGQSEIARTGTT